MTGQKEIHNALASATYGQRKLHLLTELDATESDVKRVLKRISDLENKMGNMENQCSNLSQTVTELASESEGYRNIRSRFLETYKRDKQEGTPDHRAINSMGNVAAHHGDGVTDALLYERGVRTDALTLKKIYGLGYAEILSRSRRGDTQTISVINRRGTMFAREGVPKKVEETFQGYVKELDNPQALPDEDHRSKLLQLGAQFWGECSKAKE